jgi:hypothetical protein
MANAKKRARGHQVTGTIESVTIGDKTYPVTQAPDAQFHYRLFGVSPVEVVVDYSIRYDDELAPTLTQLGWRFEIGGLEYTEEFFPGASDTAWLRECLDEDIRAELVPGQQDWLADVAAGRVELLP